MLFVILCHVAGGDSSDSNRQHPHEDPESPLRTHADAAIQDGALRSISLLYPSSKASRISLGPTEEDSTIQQGPFDDADALMSAMWVLKVHGEQEALDWARRIPRASGAEFTAEVRQVYALDDFGDVLTPELRDKMYQVQAETAAQSRFPNSQAAAVRKQRRFLVLQASNARSEAGGLPSRQALEAIAAFHERLVADNMLLAAERLQPSSAGTRLRIGKEGGEGAEAVQGPFAGGVFCGFWLIQTETLDEAEARMVRLPRAKGEEASEGQDVWIWEVQEEGSIHSSLYDFKSGHQVA